MATLDDFIGSVVTQDNHKRLNVYSKLVAHLSDPASSLHCDETDRFIDGVTGWINSSSQKISLYGLEVMCLLVSRMGEGFNKSVSTVIPTVVNRLGDNKDEVRESAQELLVRLMCPASSPAYVFDRLQSSFTHKLWRVREETLICLQNTLKYYGAKSLTLSRLVPSVVQLLEDQNSQVRETAINTLVEIYRHVGERVRRDLGHKDIPQHKMNVIQARMDEVKRSGNMVATADLTAHSRSKSVDELDSAKPLFKAPAPVGTGPKKSAGRKSTLTGKSNTDSSAGGVDVDALTTLFDNVKNVQIYSSRDVADHVNKAKDMLSDANHPWEKRIDSLKLIRALLIAGAQDYDDWPQHLRILEPCLLTSCKDLRSQVVREACCTVAYLAQRMSNKFEHTAEVLIQQLINLMANSAKIMATSGVTALKFIIMHTHSQRLIPPLTSHISSKSSVIRRQVMEFLDLLLRTWPTHVLERHIALVQDFIKKGISDADSEARAHSRRAYWAFAEHFKDQAECLMNSLDRDKQKMLQGELSNSSSKDSLSTCSSSGATKTSSAVRASRRSASIDRSNKETSQPFVRSGYGRASAMSRISSSSPRTNKDKPDGLSAGRIARSSSAQDLAGKPRSASKSRPSAARVPSGVGNYSSLPRQRTSSGASGNAISSVVSPPDRSRPRARSGVSQSQPGSRSSSPSSRYGYITRIPAPATPGTPSQGRRRSGIPRSQGASRDASPNRTGRDRRLSGSGRLHPQRMGAPQRVLGTGKEAEQFLADALKSGQMMRRRYEYDSDDAASETSSICSERSYGSAFGRTSEEVQDILVNMSSSSWSDRKEGLLSLQNLFACNRCLNRTELKKVTDMFTRMFHDPHGKVFTIFLDTLMDCIIVHKAEMHDWLFVLMTRLIQKMGVDMLGSVQGKVLRAMECVRENFAKDQQFITLTKFITDQTQTPNLKIKVKVALLNYLYELVLIMDPSDFVNSGDTRLAVSRIITWMSEPKSVDVRKSAQSLLVALFNLNTPEFSLMLSGLPKMYQDGAYKILHHHLRTASDTGDVLSPRNITSPPRGSSRFRTSPRQTGRDETENMNPEDIYDSIRKASADIQNLSFNSKYDHPPEEGKKERDSTSQDSGIQSSLPDVRVDSPDGRVKQTYNPSQYQDESMNGYDRAALAEAVFDVENDLFNEELPVVVDQCDVISEILSELSNHNERHEERKNAMLQLIKMTREGTLGLWEEHFKTVLLLLLETLGDCDGHIRALALRVLREILKSQPNRFAEYTELTILKVLEAHKDSVKEVTRAAEECASTLARTIVPETCIRVLIPIILTEEFPISLAAIKMEMKVIEHLPKHSALAVLDNIIPGLLKAYDSTESSVRKAAVFCLVALYQVIGEELKLHLTDLNGSKMKLLNLYIKRALAQQKETKSPATSDTLSPTMSDI